MKQVATKSCWTKNLQLKTVRRVRITNSVYPDSVLKTSVFPDRIIDISPNQKDQIIFKIFSSTKQIYYFKNYKFQFA